MPKYFLLLKYLSWFGYANEALVNLFKLTNYLKKKTKLLMIKMT